MAHHFRDSYRHLDPRELRERHRQLGERRAAGVHACAEWRWGGRVEHPGLPCARERWRCPATSVRGGWTLRTWVQRRDLRPEA